MDKQSIISNEPDANDSTTSFATFTNESTAALISNAQGQPTTQTAASKSTASVATTSTTSTVSAASTASIASTASRPPKDYEASYALLASSMGFGAAWGGGAPVLPKRKDKKDKKKGKKGKGKDAVQQPEGHSGGGAGGAGQTGESSGQGQSRS